MYHRMLEANQEHLYLFASSLMMQVRSEDDGEALVRRFLGDWHLRYRFVIGVWDRASGDYAGETYLGNADWDLPALELGYFMTRPWTGKGIATEAARATVRFAFDHMGVIRLDLRCDEDNIASARVAERSGFVREGLLRGQHRRRDGTIVGTLLYGMTLDDYQRSQQEQ
jgi:RimJ/RimL family protein N-acetyltransferase